MIDVMINPGLAPAACQADLPTEAIMTSIFEAFQQNQIEIPFPKRDLYLKTIPSSWQERVSPLIRENPEGNSESQT